MMTEIVIDGMMRTLEKHVKRCAKCSARSKFEIRRYQHTWGGIVTHDKKLVEQGHCDKALRMRDRLWSAIGFYRKQRVTK